MVTPISLGPVALRSPELVIKAVFDGQRLGMQLHYVDGMGKELSKARACWWNSSVIMGSRLPAVVG